MRGMGAAAIGFAAAVAGGLDAHQPGIEPVLHVALEDAVLDQRGALGGSALIVDVERAAPVRNGAVVDDRHALGGERWPIRPAKARGPLRLKSPSSPWPMASCSRMPGQPGPSTTSISPAGAGLASRATRFWRRPHAPRLPGVRAHIVAGSAAAAEPLMPWPGPAVVRDTTVRRAHQRADVAIDVPVRAHDLELDWKSLPSDTDTCSRADRARGRIHRPFATAPPLCEAEDSMGFAPHRASCWCATARRRDAGGGARYDGAADIARLPLHSLGGKLGRMRIALRLAAHHAQAKALRLIEARRFEPSVVESDRLLSEALLDEKARRHRRPAGLARRGRWPVPGVVSLLSKSESGNGNILIQ